MRVIELAADRPVTDLESVGFTVDGLAGTDAARVTVVRLEPGGVIGRHDAPVPQLLVVVSGAGQVSGHHGGASTISAGSAVIWEAGESHETRSADGLVAVVVEAPDLALPA